jgi:hypothetical protein
MKAAMVIWALLCLCGVTYAIVAGDSVGKIIGIVLAAIGAVGFVQVFRRRQRE